MCRCVDLFILKPAAVQCREQRLEPCWMLKINTYPFAHLVPRNRTVDFRGPRANTAFQIDQTAGISSCFQYLDRFCAPDAAFALHDGGSTWIDLRRTFDDLAKRDQRRRRYSGYLVFKRLAHIDQL